jgi:hypothetical protein
MHAVLGVVLEPDPHLVPDRGDLGDLADLDAEDAHVRAGEQPHGAGELTGDLDVVVARPEGVGTGRQGHDGERGDDLGHQPEARQAREARTRHTDHQWPPTETGVVRFWM